MMPPFTSHAFPSLGSHLADLSAFGEIELPLENADLTFQIDFIPSESPKEIWFGILNLPTRSQDALSGFAIRIDLSRGEIWDAQNNSGLIGNFEVGSPWLVESDQSETLLLSIKIEKRGHNLLPSLKLGHNRYLYPALPLSILSSTRMTAVAGAVQLSRDAEPFCLFPAYWLSPTHS